MINPQSQTIGKTLDLLALFYAVSGALGQEAVVGLVSDALVVPAACRAASDPTTTPASSLHGAPVARDPQQENGPSGQASGGACPQTQVVICDGNAPWYCILLGL